MSGRQPRSLPRPERGGGAHSCTGHSPTREIVYQIRRIKELIAPLGLDGSLSALVHRAQGSRGGNGGRGGLTHASVVGGCALTAACDCTELASCAQYKQEIPGKDARLQQDSAPRRPTQINCRQKRTFLTKNHLLEKEIVSFRVK